MKRFKKAVALVLALGTLASCAACGGGGSEDTLLIEAFEGGYGVQWLYDLVDAYKAKYPDKKVEIVNTTNYDEGFLTALNSGATTTDLYFGRDNMRKYMMSSTVVAGKTYSSMVADLTDVFTSTVEGENVTIENKFHENMIKVSRVEDDEGNFTYYSMPWITGVVGLAYNKKVWKDSWALPNTTDELVALCDTIKADKCTPMIYCLEDSYWSMIFDTWFAQYEGTSGYEAFGNGYDDNGERYTAEIMLTQGLLEAYEVVESLLNDGKGYMDSRSKADNFTMVQTHFLESSNKIAMIPNGDWIQREMSANYSEDEVDIAFMKTPIISSIVETLEYKNGGAYMTDSMLSDVIAAIDQGETSYEGVSANDFARLKEARNLYSGVTGHVAWVPAYSGQIDLAKDFLKYMATDEAIRVFTKATKGYTQPFKFDYLADEQTSPYIKNFMKSNYEITQTCTFISAKTDRIWGVGGLKVYYNNSRFENGFSASNENDYVSAYDYYMSEYNYVKNRWANYLQLAGIGV